MKHFFIISMILISGRTFSQLLYVPSGNGGIGASSNASIGVGNSTPYSLLHISGQTNDVLKIQSTTGGSGNTAGIDFCTFSTLSSKVARIEAVDMGAFNGELVFYTDGDGINNSNVTEKMRISMNGNLGIGTVLPSTKLHVKSSNSVDRISIQGTNSSDNMGFMIQNQDGSERWSIAAPYSTSSLQFFKGGYGNVMVLVDNGNIGIGTTNPDAKLTVNGIIHTKEVKIDLSVPAPDYVFEKDYNLPSLEQIKSYIDQNKHLPEVPSAREMEANGVNLGEMNMLLLKKVEELTIYAIEANKKIEKQQRQIEVILEYINKR